MIIFWMENIPLNSNVIMFEMKITVQFSDQNPLIYSVISWKVTSEKCII